jgi:hypothetical protein
MPFIDTHYRAVIDELVARDNLCELNNDYDFNLHSYTSINHCTNLNSVSNFDYDHSNLKSVIIDNDNDHACFDIVSTHDNVQDNVIVNEFACNISGIDTNYDYMFLVMFLMDLCCFIVLKAHFVCGLNIIL